MRPWTEGMFEGSREGLHWNLRDLQHLDRAIAATPQHRVAVQAGGNLGVYPKRLAKQFQVVYTFEPAPALFAKMVKNAPEKNIIRLQAVLGYHRQGVRMMQTRRNKLDKPAHEGVTHVDGPGHIPTLRLDDLALPVCDLLCLDVEGWELYALQGATATLARCRPVLLVEVNVNCEFEGLTRDDVRGYILEQRYRFVERLQSDELFVPEEQCSK